MSVGILGFQSFGQRFDRTQKGHVNLVCLLLDFLLQVITVITVGEHQRPFFQRPFDAHYDFNKIEGFGEIITGAHLHGVDGDLGIRYRGHHDHRRVGIAFLNFLKQIHPRHAGHHYVREDQIGHAFIHLCQSGGCIIGCMAIIAFSFKGTLKHLADCFFIIHDQDPRFLFIFHRYSSPFYASRKTFKLTIFSFAETTRSILSNSRRKISQ